MGKEQTDVSRMSDEMSGITLKEVVRSSLLSCESATSLAQVASNMSEHRCSAMVVMAEQQVLGIFTEYDAARLPLAHLDLQQPISRFMSSPVVTLKASASLREAGQLMQREQLRHLVVVDEQGQPLGICTLTDLIRHQGVEHFLTLREVRTALRKAPLWGEPQRCLADYREAWLSQGSDAMLVRLAQEQIGILTERDCVRALAQGKLQQPLASLVTPLQHRVKAETSLVAARNLMESLGIRHLGVEDEQGLLLGLLSYADILASIEYEYVTRLQQALDERDQALRQSLDNLRLAQKVIEVSLDAILITDAKGIIISVNPRFTELTGYSADEALGQTPNILSSGQHSKAFYENMWATIDEQGFWQGEIWNKRKSGEIYPEWLSITAIYDEQGKVRQYAAIFSDISDRKASEERIKRLAYFDELTGLANRRLFQDRLQMAIANAHRHQHQLALLFLDLDMFKRINDSLGHSIGDKVLQIVAKRLKVSLREGDTAARLGGDEFTILVPELNHIDEAVGLAKRILKVLEAPVQIGGRDLYVSSSIGIACYPQDGDSSERLLKAADVAMYKSKERGRNAYSLYKAELEANNHAKMSLEGALRKALNKHHFQLYYQPRTALATGELTGFEALVRWPSAEGMRSPASFLPLADELGLMPQLSHWVMDEVCRQQRQWLEQGYKIVPVAINLSVQDLRNRGLALQLRRVMEQHGIPARWLELEITEESFIPAEADHLLKVLSGLREQGHSIAIDDFGTGYSCLSYLKRLPVDALKIDASFIRGIPLDGDDIQLTSTIISLAHGLGLNVIAEGVETHDQRDFLLQEACDEAQGFWFAKPMPHNEAEKWLAPASVISGGPRSRPHTKLEIPG